MAGSSSVSEALPAYVRALSVDQLSSSEAYIAGLDTDTESLHSYICGQLSFADQRDAYIAGSVYSASSQDAYVSGIEELSSSISASTHGQDDADSQTSAFVSGVVLSVSDTHAFVVGFSTNETAVHAYVVGYPQTFNITPEPADATTGTIDPNISIGFMLLLFSLRTYVCVAYRADAIVTVSILVDSESGKEFRKETYLP